MVSWGGRPLGGSGRLALLSGPPHPILLGGPREGGGCFPSQTNRRTEQALGGIPAPSAAREDLSQQVCGLRRGWWQPQ